jgi:hypothetical protein
MGAYAVPYYTYAKVVIYICYAYVNCACSVCSVHSVSG